MRKTLLSLALLAFALPSFAAKIRVVSMWPAPGMEDAWDLGVRGGQSARLDCQSFFHHLSVVDGGANVTAYLDEEECWQWQKRFFGARVFTPVCAEVSGGEAREIRCD